MANPVDYAINHARLTIAALAFLLIAGLVAYVTIPKEAEPDVKIPIIYTLLSQRGISPEDAERLLIKPVETKLKSVSNVKEMRAVAFEGGGYVLLEFEAGFNSKTALARSEEHTSELQSPCNLVCRLLLEKKNSMIGTANWAAPAKQLIMYSFGP